MQFNHEGEVNKVRHMPQSHNLIATKTVSGEVHIFDYQKHPSFPVNKEVRPNLRLMGHEKEGYGLAWNSKDEGVVMSGSDDGIICIWDLKEVGSLEV
jgi:WD40 repeat protein